MSRWQSNISRLWERKKNEDSDKNYIILKLSTFRKSGIKGVQDAISLSPNSFFYLSFVHVLDIVIIIE